MQKATFSEPGRTALQETRSALEVAMESRGTEDIIAAMQGAGPADAALLPAAAHLLAQLLAVKTKANSPAPEVGVLFSCWSRARLDP